MLGTYWKATYGLRPLSWSLLPLPIAKHLLSSGTQPLWEPDRATLLSRTSLEISALGGFPLFLKGSIIRAEDPMTTVGNPMLAWRCWQGASPPEVVFLRVRIESVASLPQGLS